MTSWCTRAGRPRTGVADEVASHPHAVDTPSALVDVERHDDLRGTRVSERARVHARIRSHLGVSGAPGIARSTRAVGGGRARAPWRAPQPASSAASVVSTGALRMRWKASALA